jgi:hypothetical protein
VNVDSALGCSYDFCVCFFGVVEGKVVKRTHQSYNDKKKWSQQNA